jgi:mycothiol synthase
LYNITPVGTIMPEVSESDMAVSPFNIRNYRPADFNAFVLVYQEAEKQEPIGRPITPQAITDKLSRPVFSIEHDLLVVEKDGEIVGFMDMLPELDIQRLIIDCWLLPEHRRQGLGKKLLKLAVKRAVKLGARFLHVMIREDNNAAVAVLSKSGFECVRRFLELRLNLNKIDQSELARASGGCRHLREGEEETLTNLQNRSFGEHWGYNPETVETMSYNISMSHRSPKDIVLACEEDEVTGYCWTEIVSGGQGRIFMIGSDPDYRGKGIGRKLLLAGIANLQNMGVDEVWLTVDSENETARSLYESTGFKLQRSYLWYEKSVN